MKLGKPKRKPYDYESEQVVVKWLEGIKKVGDYLREFNDFLEWLKQRHPTLDTPTKLIEKRRSDLRSDDPTIKEFFEMLVVAYKTDLEARNYKATTGKAFIRSVMSFFARNRLPLEFKRKEMEFRESDTVKAQKKAKWIIGNEEIRAVYTIGSVEDRAMLLVGYQSGIIGEDLAHIRIEQFQNTVGESKLYDSFGNWKAQGHIYFEYRRQKTDEMHKSVISEEAIFDIGLMLKQRGYPKEGYLFASQRSEKITTAYVNRRLKELVTRALGDAKGKAFKESDLRDSYHDSLERANLTKDVKDYLFGHKPKGAVSAYEVGENTILEAYQKVFVYLSVNGIRRSKEEFEDLKTTIINQQNEIEDLKRRLTVFNERLADYEEFKQSVQGLSVVIEQIQKEKQRKGES